MLERVIAFGVVVALLFGLATFARDDRVVPAEAGPLESAAPACPEGGCPPVAPAAPPAPARGAPVRSWDDEGRDRDDDKDEGEKEDKEEKRGKGKRGRD